MGKNRLEAFSDGVIAIIITIMVLEMKVPQGDSLMARIDPTEIAHWLDEPHVRPMDFTGRPMKGLVFRRPSAAARRK